MSERGVFALDRGWFGHPCFADEPFTEREAWAWLISEASFKARVKRIGSIVVPLDRGQLAASLRFMAEAWQWEHTRVHRFLGRLKTATMIEQQTERNITVITISNYDKYQRVSLPDATPIETKNATATQQQRNKLEDTKIIELDVVAEARPKPLVSEEARKLADELLVIAGHTLSFVPPGWCGAAMRVQSWLSDGWPREIIIAAVRGAATRKRGPPANSVQFFENAVAEEVARQSAPLPKVEIREAKTITVNHGTTQNKSASAYAKHLAEQFESQSSDSIAGNPDAFLRLSQG